MINIKNRIKTIALLFIMMLLSAAATIFLFHTVLLLAYIPSGSMVNTIPERSVVLALRVNGTKALKRDDIAIFEAQNHTTAGKRQDAAYYAKRVVGLPGDTVEVIDGTTCINGTPYDETEYLFEQPDKLNYGPFSVPDDCYFMMGDNRNDSFDSRYWDDPYVKQNEIIGVIFFVFKFFR